MRTAACVWFRLGDEGVARMMGCGVWSTWVRVWWWWRCESFCD